VDAGAAPMDVLTRAARRPASRASTGPSSDVGSLEGVQTKREVMSYALQRRATLEALRRIGRTHVSLDSPTQRDACDADPMLVRSALHHGEPASEPCPVCASDHLTTLNYTFGDQLGQYSGRIKSTAELAEMETEVGEFRVVVVEVCPDCRWNHMTTSFLLGDGRKRRPPRRQPTVEDIYG